MVESFSWKDDSRRTLFLGEALKKPSGGGKGGSAGIGHQWGVRGKTQKGSLIVGAALD